MRVFVITPPEPVISWQDVDAHLKLDGDVEQAALVEAYIAAATGHIDGPDGWLGRSIGVQTLEARCDTPTCGSCIRLPFPPVIELVSVSYLDATGVEQMADLEDFEVMGRDLVPSGFEWPWEGGSWRREAVRIRYRAGYEAAPAPIKAALLLMVGDLYRNRETVSAGAMTHVPMSATVENLLAPFRVFG
ncbi:head-tail connector protein [Sphingomonas parapaucimobilis]|uniref:head-tail connector protein n=1 Tax=Sphingomonas parapaucimobilis TaxID=28213 RepID=UPI00321A206C